MDTNTAKSKAQSPDCKNSGEAFCYLLPCPFCGSKNVAVGSTLLHDKSYQSVDCLEDGCGMCGPVRLTREVAIRDWNNRSGKNDLSAAEQQFLGFKSALSEGNISSLVKSMGLFEDEWDEMQKLFDMSYLTDDDIDEISSAVCSR